MRTVLIGALLSVASVAHAQPEVCKSERLEAEQNPPVAEDVRAYQACLEKWRAVAARAKEELGKPPPDKRAGCELAFTTWQTSSQSDPNNYDALVTRLRAREEVDRCNAGYVALHPPPEVAARIAAADRRAEAESVLLGAGGVGLTAAGGVGIATLDRPSTNSVEGNAFAVLALAIGGALTGAMVLSGAIVLGFGARQHARARQTTATGL
jgi:hypothetical protein